MMNAGQLMDAQDVRGSFKITRKGVEFARAYFKT